MNRYIPVLIVCQQLLLFTMAWGQDKPVPPPREMPPGASTPKETWPNIDLPEYVITGSDRISFSDNHKESITLSNEEEFTARAGIGGREPWIGWIPPNGRSPELTSLNPRLLQMFGRAGFGRFGTAVAEAWLAGDFETWDIQASGEFESGNGHVAKADYLKYSTRFSGGTFIPRSYPGLLANSRLQGDISIRRHAYSLYGLHTDPSQPILDYDRGRTVVAYGAHLISRNNSLAEYSASLSASHNIVHQKVRISDSLDLPEQNNYEHQYSARVDHHRSVFGIPVDFEFLSTFIAYTRSAANPISPFYVGLNSSGEYNLMDDLAIRFGLGFLLYRGSDIASRGRLTPSARLTYLFDPELRVFASIRSHVARSSASDMYTANPYVQLGPVLRHREIPVRTRIGVEYDERSTLSAEAYVEYFYSTMYPWFRKLPSPHDRTWELLYDRGTSVSSLNVSGSWQFSVDDLVIAGLNARSSKNSEAGDKVAYLPDFEINGTYRRGFSFPLTIEASVHAAIGRTAAGADLDSYISVGGMAEYRFSSYFGAYFSIRNLLDQEYAIWEGYSERPLHIEAGFTARY